MVRGNLKIKYCHIDVLTPKFMPHTCGEILSHFIPTEIVLSSYKQQLDKLVTLC